MPAATTTLPVKPKPKTELPHIFGLGLRDRLLMLLAVNERPLYVAEICEMLGNDHRKVRNTMLPLLQCGVIVKDDRRFGARYITLNKGFPAYLQLLRFLRVLEKRYPQPRRQKPRRKAERFALHDLLLEPDAREVSGKQLDGLFYSRIRSRVLLGIGAIADTDVTDLVRTLSLDNRSAWNAVNHWQREGIIRSALRGRRRALELDPTYPAARELRLLLRRLIATAQEYAILAKFSSRNEDGPGFVVLR